MSAEAATRVVLYEKVFLKISQNSQENTCARISFLIKLQASQPATFSKKRQVFSSKFCESFKNNFFAEHPRVTVSVSD